MREEDSQIITMTAEIKASGLWLLNSTGNLLNWSWNLLIHWRSPFQPQLWKCLTSQPIRSKLLLNLGMRTNCKGQVWKNEMVVQDMQIVESHAYDHKTQDQNSSCECTWWSQPSDGGLLEWFLCCLFLPILLVVPCLSLFAFMLVPHWLPTNPFCMQVNDTIRLKLRTPIIVFLANCWLPPVLCWTFSGYNWC